MALDHLAKCLENARRFQAALDREAPLPPHLELTLFAGDGRWTPASAAITGYSVRIEEEVPGDGVVPRYSVLMDEGFALRPEETVLDSPIPWSDVNFLFAEHLALTGDPAFIDTLLFNLLKRP